MQDIMFTAREYSEFKYPCILKPSIGFNSNIDMAVITIKSRSWPGVFNIIKSGGKKAFPGIRWSCAEMGREKRLIC
jgi:hypothetical protein